MRISELVGKSILTADSGEKLGTVADLLLENAHVVGIVLGGGWFGGEKILPFTDVQAVGRDAVVARSQGGVVDARQWHEQKRQAARASHLRDKLVVTTGGRQIGAVRDVFVDERTGTIEGYDIAWRAFAGLMSRHTTLPQSDDIKLGPDALIVSEEAAAGLEAGHGPGRREPAPDSDDAAG